VPNTPDATAAATTAASPEPGTQATQDPGPATQAPAATQETRPAATEAGTAQPNATTGAETDVMVQSSNLIGQDLTDETGAALGQITDALVNAQGEIQYIIVELPAVGGAEARTVAIDWQQVETMVEGTVENTRLQFSGTPADLETALTFDLDAALEQQIVINTQGSDLDEAFNNLLRLSMVPNVRLEDSTNLDLGQLQDLLVDVQTGQVDYAVVDFGTLLGTDAATIAVPWSRLNLSMEGTPEDPALRLEISPELLAQAPLIDLASLPTWIDANQTEWRDALDAFWDTAS